MPTATEHDPLPLPDYELDYGESEGERIDARVNKLRSHRRGDKAVAIIALTVLGFALLPHATTAMIVGYVLALLIVIII
jgi:hypothetical protein